MDKRQVFCNDRGTLYLIATPIGNLSDISSRTKETLDMVDYLNSKFNYNLDYNVYDEKQLIDKVVKLHE